MSRVFVVQQPTGRNKGGHIVPTMDLSPAKDFGELLFVLREFENPFDNIDATAIRITAFLQDHKMDKDDWLLLVGNPILIGLVSSIAVERLGVLRVLQWSRNDHAYTPVEVQLSPLDRFSGAA